MRSHLGEPDRLTGPAHFHMNSTLVIFIFFEWGRNFESAVGK